MNIPDSFKNYKQWVNWKIIEGAKIPVDGTSGYKINAHNVDNYLTFNDAFNRTINNPGIGVGFVITDNDPFFLLDIDHALQDDGSWSPLAIELCSMFHGTYQEISISGEAIHIIGTTDTNIEHKCKNTVEKIELYTRKRFVAITGTGAIGDPTTPVNIDIYKQMVETYFQPSYMVSDDSDWTIEPDPRWHGPTDDEKLIRKMLNSNGSASSILCDNRPTIKDLWVANIKKLSLAYPHEGLPFDASSADQALLSHLAFWTGKNCERMERLFSKSKLVRDKWVKREDYRRRSILNACRLTENVYGQGITIDEATQASQIIQQQVVSGSLEATIRQPGFQLMTPDAQLEYFRGCVYICDENKIMIPNRRMLKKQQFDAYYGGWVFSVDAENDKTVKSAWDVFTMSQAVNFPKVDSKSFEPRNTIGLIINPDNTTAVNSYIPPNVPSVPGDITRFLNHLKIMIPCDNDLSILLAWCAAVVQYPGYKFGWSPVIQGTFGNGKSMIAAVLTQAVGGQYVHSPDAQEIGEKYNDWLLDKILINIEEMYSGKDKYTTAEKLKNMITAEKLEIRAMQAGKIMRNICGNILLLTNHKDAVIKTREDRRLACIFTAQQTYEDMQRDNLLGNYFPDLYNWLRGTGSYQGQTPGYHYITYYLQTYNIPDTLNPATDAGGLCHRAPETSSMYEAISHSLNSAEQLIQDATAEELPGFRGGFISSVKVAELLRNNHIKAARRRYPEMLRNLGYIKHPSLVDGKASSRNNFDKARPRIYVNKETLNNTSNLQPKNITRLYLEAQGFLENPNDVFKK